MTFFSCIVWLHWLELMNTILGKYFFFPFIANLSWFWQLQVHGLEAQCLQWISLYAFLLSFGLFFGCQTHTLFCNPHESSLIFILLLLLKPFPQNSAHHGHIGVCESLQKSHSYFKTIFQVPVIGRLLVAVILSLSWLVLYCLEQHFVGCLAVSLQDLWAVNLIDFV